MKLKNSTKKLIGFFAFAAVLTLSTASWARPYRARVHDPKVNTAIEKKYDFNHDGKIGLYERSRMAVNRVNRPGEYRCDFNHNGWIDTTREKICKY